MIDLLNKVVKNIHPFGLNYIHLICLLLVTTMLRKCVNSPKSFCYVCNSFMLKEQEKIMTSTMKKAHELYFNREVANLDKNYVSNYCCTYCLRHLLAWLKGAMMSMKFAVPMIWKKQQNHVDDCYCCLEQVPSGINWYKKRKVNNPDLNSAQPPLPYSDILPIPISPEKEKESDILQSF